MNQATRAGSPAVGTRPRRGWSTVALLGVGAFAVGTDMFIVSGLLVGLATDLDMRVSTAGLAVTAFGLAYAIGAASFGSMLSARVLPRPVLIGSVALTGLFAAVSALAPTFSMLLAARALGGLAAACYLPAAGAAAAAAMLPEYRGRALAAVLGGGSSAMLLGAPAGVLLAGWLSWRATFGMVTVLAAITVGGLLFSGVGSGGLVRSTRPPTLRRPVGILAVTATVMTGSNAVFAYLGAVLPDAGPVGIALVIAAFGLGGLGGSWWGGSATDRHGGRSVAMWAVVALLGTFAAFPLAAPTLAGSLAVALTWGAAAWAYVPAQQHRLIGFQPRDSAFAARVAQRLDPSRFAAGALFSGLVVDTAGAGSLWLLAVGSCAAALTLHTLLPKETS